MWFIALPIIPVSYTHLIEDVVFDEEKFTDTIKEVYRQYLKSRSYVHGNENRDVCLMDIALIAMKELRKKGMVDDLDVSDEVNACSISVDVDVDGQKQEWLVMFKNETHNHPTEIEPFGGAATCLGGAIRDPLSGRSYVYQAMSCLLYTSMVEVDTGREIATAVTQYRHGVMDEYLPDGVTKLDHDWALQHPQDYLDVLGETIPAVLKETGVDPEDVIGVGMGL